MPQQFANGGKYVGEYKDGKRTGQGTFTYANGAKCACLMTGYASRLEGGFLPFYPKPDVIGNDLIDVARGLLGC